MVVLRFFFIQKDERQTISVPLERHILFIVSCVFFWRFKSKITFSYVFFNKNKYKQWRRRSSTYQVILRHFMFNLIQNSVVLIDNWICIFFYQRVVSNISFSHASAHVPVSNYHTHLVHPRDEFKNARDSDTFLIHILNVTLYVYCNK